MTILRWLVLSSLLLLAGCVAPGGGPRERDVWHAFVDEDVRYGYQHTTVTKLPDGNFQYVVETRTLLNMLGAKQEITKTAECVVTPSYVPVSVKAEGRQASGETGVRGRACAGKFEVTFVRGDLERNRTIDLGTRPILDVCLVDWLGDQPVDGRAVRLRVIDTDGWRLLPGTATRQSVDASGQAWSFELGAAGGRGTLVCEPDGSLRKMDFVVPRAHLRRCTAEDAKDIRHLELRGRNILMFPIGRPIGPPHRLAELTVKLTWKGLPFDLFELEDARQKVLSKSEKDGQYQAVVQIKDPATTASNAGFPIRRAEMSPYLAETSFIKPKNAEMIATAREVVEGKKTALGAVQAISEWVSKNVASAMIAETLTGPEVLECRKGKCAEYAVLFASLARSVGIPTRVVLGERMVVGHWVGHMWNEAFVGQWTPVDASANEVGRSLALLKFVHSDSVPGTTEVRFRLIDSLNVSIEDAKKRPSGLTDKYETGIQGRVYTNTDHACRFTAPEGWTIEDAAKRGVSTFRFHVPGKDPKVMVHLVLFSLPGGTGLEPLIAARLTALKARYKSIELLKNEPCEINGASGRTIQFRRKTESKEGVAMVKKTTEHIWQQGSSLFLLNLIAEESAHDKHAPAFAKLLASYEHLKP